MNVGVAGEIKVRSLSTSQSSIALPCAFNSVSRLEEYVASKNQPAANEEVDGSTMKTNIQK